MISGVGAGERMKKMKKDVRIIGVEELLGAFDGRLFEEGIGWWINLDDYRVSFDGTLKEEEELLIFFHLLLNTMEGYSGSMLSRSDLGGILFMVDVMEQNGITIDMGDKEDWKFIIEEYLYDVGRRSDEPLYTCDGRVWERVENGYRLVGMRMLDEEIGFKEEERKENNMDQLFSLPNGEVYKGNDQGILRDEDLLCYIVGNPSDEDIVDIFKEHTDVTKLVYKRGSVTKAYYRDQMIRESKVTKVPTIVLEVPLYYYDEADRLIPLEKDEVDNVVRYIDDVGGWSVNKLTVEYKDFEG